MADGLDKIDLRQDRLLTGSPPSARRSPGRRPGADQGDFERLGIPRRSASFLAGVGAQYDSEVVYHSVKEELTKIGVVFMGTEQGLKEYP